MIYSNISQVQAMANKYNIGKVYISTRKNKKYMVKKPDGKMIHFGEIGYQDFTAHQDEKRRENFRKRNKKWSTGEKWTPAWLSYHILWN